MNFTKESLQLIKQLKNIRIQSDKNHIIFLNKILELYKSIKNNDIFIDYFISESSVNYNVNSKYISKFLLDKINKINILHKYNINYKNLKINLKLGGYKLDNVKILFLIKTIILMWLLSDKSRNNLDINLILLNEKKKIDNTKHILTINEINSGYTFHDSIIIYRKEELNKVLIHELIHLLDLDISIYDTNNLNFDLFINIHKNNNIKINEAYVETFACFINCILSCYSTNRISKFDEYFSYEIKFSLLQVAKILIFYGYKSSLDFFKEYKDGMFLQKTSIFSYYIIKSSFLYNFNKFTLFASNMSLKKYENLIKKTLLDNKFILLIDKFIKYIKKETTQNNMLQKTLRMSLIEI